jgi:hypothetical protein
MYIMASMSYPLSSTDKVVEKYLEILPKYPPDESLGDRVVPFGSFSDENGLTTIVITDVKPGKLDDAVKRANEVYVQFRNIEGVSYKIRVLNNAEEALEPLGIGT